MKRVLMVVLVCDSVQVLLKHDALRLAAGPLLSLDGQEATCQQSGNVLRPGLWCKFLIAKGGSRSPQILRSAGVCRYTAVCSITALFLQSEGFPILLQSRLFEFWSLLQTVKVAGMASLRMPLQDCEVAL